MWNTSDFILFISIFLLLPCLTVLNSQTKTDPAQSLPQILDGWKVSTERTFNDSTLYDYIDGGAELFLSFGFSKVYNRIYTQPDQPDILVDIFYMNSSYDAFGVFSFSVGQIGNDFGVQSQVANGAIVFWKDNYYVSITCYPETEESEKAATELARLIDKLIPEKGKLPAILDYLPAQSLDKESIRYFRHYIWLNSHLFISNENILNINQNTDAVLAKYGENDKSVLLIIKYPNGSDAAAAKESFIKNFNPELMNNPMAKMKNGKQCGVELVKNFIIAVFNSVDEHGIKNLINQTKERID